MRLITWMETAPEWMLAGIPSNTGIQNGWFYICGKAPLSIVVLGPGIRIQIHELIFICWVRFDDPFDAGCHLIQGQP